MRLLVLSDLPVEFGAFAPPSPLPGHDAVVVAGDVGERLAARVLPWLRATVPGPRPVLCVPGNHDFYRTTLQREIAAARGVAAELGLHRLAEGESVALGGTRFVGATLWTDHALKPEARVHAMNAVQDRMTGMNDHRRIKALVPGGINVFGPRWPRVSTPSSGPRSRPFWPSLLPDQASWSPITPRIRAR